MANDYFPPFYVSIKCPTLSGGRQVHVDGHRGSIVRAQDYDDWASRPSNSKSSEVDMECNSSAQSPLIDVIWSWTWSICWYTTLPLIIVISSDNGPRTRSTSQHRSTQFNHTLAGPFAKLPTVTISPTQHRHDNQCPAIDSLYFSRLVIQHSHGSGPNVNEVFNLIAALRVARQWLSVETGGSE